MWAELRWTLRGWRRPVTLVVVFSMLVGGVVALLPISPAQAAVQTYADDFATYDYNGSTGSAAWAGPWVDDEGDGPSSGGIVVEDDARCAVDPCLMIGKGGGDTIFVERPVDLSAATTATLEYEFQVHTHGAGVGAVNLWISDDDGVGWSLRRTYLLFLDLPATPDSIDISAFATSQTRIGFELVGGSDDSHINIDNLVITADTNGAPVVDPVAPITSDEQVAISFTATATDPEGDSFTFALSGEPTGAAINPTSGDFSWTPTEAQGPGVYTFDITATDGAPATGSTSVTITVDEVAQSPTVTPIGDRTDAENDVISLPVVASDPDIPVDSLVYSQSNLPPGLSIDSATGVVSGTIDFVAAASSPYNVTLSVSDGATAPDSTAFVWTVTNTNRTPVLDPVAPITAGEQTTVTFTASATEPDGEAVVFGLSGAPPGAAIDPASGVFSWTPTEAQGPAAYSFDVTATDPLLATATTAVSVTVGEVNRPPSLPALADRTDAEGSSVALAAGALDPDLPTNTLTYSATGLPPGLAIDPASGAITGTVGYGASSASPFGVTVHVGDDGSPSGVDQATFVWNTPDTNRAPTLDPIGNRTVDEGLALALTATATDPDLDGLAFSLEGLVPAGAEIDPVTGDFSWTPTEIQDGVHTFDFVVSDDGNPALTDREAVSISVGEVNTDPILAPVPDLTDVEGAAVSLSVAATDDDLPGDPLTWSATGLPSGLAIDPTTGTITGTIGYSAAGGSPHTVTVRVDDGRGGEAQTTFVWTIANTNRNPVVGSVAPITVEPGVPVTFGATATDPDGDPVSFGLAGGPPAGASISPAGAFTWTPPETIDPGVYRFDLIASDGNGGVGRTTVAITVLGSNHPPEAADQSTAVFEDESLSLTLNGTDADGDDLTFVVIAEPEHGTVAGVGPDLVYRPDRDYVGADSFTFQVADPEGESTTGVVHIEVLAVNDAPLARPDDYATSPGETLSVAAPGVLGNDSDIDDVVLVAALLGPPDRGSLNLAADGGFEYTADPGQTGDVQFTYSIEDPAGLAATTEVTIHVEGTPTVASVQRQAAVEALVGYASDSVPAVASVSDRTVRRTLVLMSSASSVAIQQMGFPLLMLVSAALAMAVLGKLRLVPLFGRRTRGTGIILSFSEEDGYGLIVPDGESRELFAHTVAIRRRDRDRIATGDVVGFSVIRGEHRDLATRVRRITGGADLGSA